MLDWDGNGKISPVDIGISLAALGKQAEQSILLAEYELGFVQELNPERNLAGKIKLFQPQEKYEKKNQKALHKYGAGPFCAFRLKNGTRYKNVSGVYALLDNDGCLLYVGQTVNLEQRFNTGYGNIQPINCYIGGQSTNCKINKMVLEKYQKGQRIFLYFLPTADYDRIEHELIAAYKPPYNADIPATQGKEPRRPQKEQHDLPDTDTDFEKLWGRIIAHQKENFHLSQGKVFQYIVSGNAVYPKHITGAVPKTEFLKAFSLKSVSSVIQLREHGISMPSYVFAIMRDERISYLQNAACDGETQIRRTESAIFNFSENDTVVHRVFGKGTVVSITPMSGDALITVKFEDGSQRRLMQRAAQLKRI